MPQQNEKALRPERLLLIQDLVVVYIFWGTVDSPRQKIAPNLQIN